MNLYEGTLTLRVYFWAESDTVAHVDLDDFAREAMRDHGEIIEDGSVVKVDGGHNPRGWTGLPYGDDPTGKERYVPDIIAAMGKDVTSR